MVLIKMGKSRPRTKSANGIIVKNYEHYNRAFSGWDNPQGKYIGSKAEYQRELDKHGMITCDEAERKGMNSGAKRTAYSITSDTQQLIENVKQTADANGNIHPGDRAIEALTEKVNRKYNPEALPKDAPTEGGFGE